MVDFITSHQIIGDQVTTLVCINTKCLEYGHLYFAAATELSAA